MDEGTRGDKGQGKGGGRLGGKRGEEEKRDKPENINKSIF